MLTSSPTRLACETEAKRIILAGDAHSLARRRLAWYALKSARGAPVRQTVIQALARGQRVVRQ